MNGVRRMGWRVVPAGFAGVACAACCVAPLLVAAGVVAGGATVGAVLGWLPGVAIALVLVAAIVFLVPVRARQHRRRCPAGSGCDCTGRAGSATGSTLAP